MEQFKQYALTQSNLEKCGWLFSPSLQLMVYEHETVRAWDIDISGYKPVGDDRWEPDTNIFDSYDTFTEMRAKRPDLFKVSDWIHGDDVEMW